MPVFESAWKIVRGKGKERRGDNARCQGWGRREGREEERRRRVLKGKIDRRKCCPMGKSTAADALFVKAKEEEESRRVKLALLCSKPQVWVHAEAVVPWKKPRGEFKM
eukprot:169316-Rhodomonas_salina.1